VTVTEAYELGVARLRKPYWNEFAHIDLPPVNADGLHGSWAVMVDPPSQQTLNIPPHKYLLAAFDGMIDPDSEQFDEWTPPPRYEELFGRVPDYADHWKQS
jgi:hypothetical protein